MVKSTNHYKNVPTTSSIFGKKPRAVTEPTPLESHGPARIIAIVNQKGGVGKTTSTINLGASLAEVGRRVLVVDLDPQGALSVGLGVPLHELETTIFDLMLNPEAPYSEALIKTSVPGLDLIPSNQDLSGADLKLADVIGREQILKEVLVQAVADYDFILIDCQPTLGLLTVNALTAANSVIVPLQCEHFALRGVAHLHQIIEKAQQRLNPQLEIEGILATMYDSRTLHSKEVLSRICEAFPSGVFETVIARTVRFPDTTVAGEPITTFAPSSDGAYAYRRLARELIEKGALS